MTAAPPHPCDRRRLKALLEEALALADPADTLIAVHLATALALLDGGADQSRVR